MHYLLPTSIVSAKLWNPVFHWANNTCMLDMPRNLRPEDVKMTADKSENPWAVTYGLRLPGQEYLLRIRVEYGTDWAPVR